MTNEQILNLMQKHFKRFCIILDFTDKIFSEAYPELNKINISKLNLHGLAAYFHEYYHLRYRVKRKSNSLSSPKEEFLCEKFAIKCLKRLRAEEELAKADKFRENEWNSPTLYRNALYLVNEFKSKLE